MAAVLFLALLTSACENLFRSGLGESVDIEPPSVTIESHIDGQFVSFTESFGGTFGDDLGTPQVEISLVPLPANGDSPQPDFVEVDSVDGEAGQWSHSVNTSAFEDGEHELRVRATDGSGKRTDAKAVVRVDNNASVIVVNQPSVYGPGNAINGTVAVSGEAYDLSGIRSVELEITAAPAAGPPVTVRGTAAGTNAWSYLLDTEEIGGTALIGSTGSITISVIATDRAGNTNAELFHASDLQQSLGYVPSAQDIFLSVSGSSAGGSLPAIPDGASTPGFDLTVNQALDAPVFQLSQPVELEVDPADTPDPTGAGRGVLNPDNVPAEILGSISDDDGVVTGAGEIQIRISEWSSFDSSDSSTWTDIPAGQLSGSGERVNFSWNVSGEPQGIWRMQLRARELPEPGETLASIGWTESEVFEFALDSGAPTITIDTPETTDPYSQPFTVTGGASDGFEVARVEVSLDGGVSWINVNDSASGTVSDLNTTTATWDYTFTPGALGDGDYTAMFRVADPGDRLDTAEFDFSVDVTGPSIEDISLPASPVAVVNGMLTVTGRAVDLSGLDSVWAWVGPAGPGIMPPTATVSGAGTAGDPFAVSGWDAVGLTGTTNWEWSADTLGGDSNYDDGTGLVPFDDGTFRLHLVAVDNAGNPSTIATRDFEINDATDLPAFSFSNLDVTTAVADDNTFDASLTIFGEVTDDDLVDASSIEVQVSADAGVSWGAWTTVSSAPTTDSGRVSFSHSITGASDGEYRLRFRASDLAGAKDDLAAVQTLLLGAAGSGGAGGDQGIPISVDIGPPVVSLSSPEPGIFANGPLTLEGTAVDGNAVSSVEVRVGASTNPYQAATDLAAGADEPWSTWEYTIDPDALGLGDGSVSVSVRAEDPAGKTSELSYNFNLDTAAPAVALLNPATGAELNDTVSVNGTASDSNIIEQVWVAVLPQGSAPTPIGDSGWETDWNATTGTFSWALDLVTGDLNPTDSAQNYTIHVIAEDIAGNRTPTAVSRNIIIDQSTDIPLITLSNVGPTALDTVFASSDTINGTASDDDQVDRVEWSDDGGSTWSSAGVTYTGTATDRTFAIPIGGSGLGLSEGPDVQAVLIRAVDVDAFGGSPRSSDEAGGPETVEFYVDDAAPVLAETAVGTAAQQISNAAVTLSGTISDSTGIDALEVTTNGGAPQSVAFTPAGAGSWSWTYEVPDSADGEFDLTFVAHDIAGRADSIQRSVMIDTTAPAAPAIDALTAPFFADSLPISGTASDTLSGIETVEYSFDFSDDGDDTNDTWTPATGTDTWFGSIDISALAEGARTLSLRTRDRAGNPSGRASTAYTIDRTDPALAVTSGLAGSGVLYANSDITIAGTASDGNGVDSVLVETSFNGGATEELLNDVIDDGTWSVLFDAAARSDGEYQFTITATDGVGRTRVLERTLQLDRSAPLAEFSSVSPVVDGTPVDSINGAVSVRATISDDVSLDTVSWAILPAGTTPAAGDYTLVTGSRTAPLIVADTTQTTGNVTVNGAGPYDVSFLDGQDIVVWFRAIDRAGNQSEVARNLLVDQSSDNPRITLTTLDAAADTPGESLLNLIESSGLLRFTVEDDDLVDAGSLEISVGDGSSWQPLNFGGQASPANSRSVNTRHDLYDPVQLPEGTTQFWLRASDLSAEKAGLPVAQTVLGPVYIMVDRSFPTLAETELAAASVFRSSVYGLSGSAGDTNDIATITATESVDGAATAPVAVTGPGGAALSLGGGSDTSADWEVSGLPSGGVADGIYDYEITVEDASGKQTIVSRQVIIDTTAPVAPSVTSIAPGAWLNGSTNLVGGDSDDGPSGSGVETVFWTETADGVATPGFTDPAGDPGSVWNAVTTAPDGSWNATVASGGSGLRTLHLRARDSAGNLSAAGQFDFGIDPSAPVLSLDGGAVTQRVNDDFTVSGAFSDISGLASLDVAVSSDNVTFAPADPAPASFDNVAGTWSWSRVLGGQADGIYYYRFTATDLAGNTTEITRTVDLDRTAPAISFSNTLPDVNTSFDGTARTADANGSMSLAGSVSDNQGVANLETIEYRIDGGSWQALPITGTFLISGIDTTTAYPSGTMVVDVRAIDGNGNESVSDFTLNVDEASDLPVVTITGPEPDAVSGIAEIAASTTTVSGTVVDDDGIDNAMGSVEYRFSDDGTPAGFGAWQNVAVSGSATSRSFSFALTSPSNGTKLLEIRATDTNGLGSDAAGLTLNFDTSEPEFSGLSPANGVYLDGDFTISGNAADDNGDIDVLQYRVERDGTQIIPTTPGDWIALPGTPAGSIAFSDTIDTMAGTGVYDVILQATDNGGFTRESTVSVFVDRTAPNATVTSPVAGSTVNNIVTLHGSATDPQFGVESVLVEVVDTGDADGDSDTTETVALPTGTLQPFSTNTTVSWSVTGFDTRDATLLSHAVQDPDGTSNTDLYELTLRITATDRAGNTSAPLDHVIRIDQTSDRPVITIDDIAADGSSTIQTTTVSGNVSDDDGIAAGGIVVDVWNAGNSGPTPDSTEAVTLTSGSFGGADLDWTVSLTSGGNGLRGIRVRAIDIDDNNGQDYGATDWSRTDTGRIDFRLDTENPDLAITTPTVGTAWSDNDPFTVTGTAGDENGITALVYKVDDGDLSVGTTSLTPADPWSFTIPAADLADGPRTLYVQATDAVGNTTQRSVSITVDTTAPTISVTSPVAGTAVFGPLTINGTAADLGSGAQGVDAVSVGLGRQIDATSEATLAASTWISVPGTTSWSYDFLNINDYANATFSVNTGDLNGDGVEDPGESWTNLWDFTFYVRAVDNAGTGGGGVSGGGNTAYLTSYTVQIDPLQDRPEVSILSPSDGATVGGSLRVFGSAFDSQFVEKVQIAIDANNNGDYTDDTWSEGVLDETDPDGTRWYLANGTTSWNVRLNDAGEFDPTGGSSTNTIRFKVRAKDYKVTPGDGIFGAEEAYSVTFNRDFPQFDGFNLVTGETVGGTVVWTGIIRDESNIERIDFTNESPLLNSTIVFENPGGLLPPPVSGNVTGLATTAAASAGMTVELLAQDDPDYDAAFPGSYRVAIPIDTTAPGLYPGGAGSMSVRLVAEDSTTPSPFTNQAPLSLNVDNVLPSSLTYTGDAEILGSSAELSGSVRDTGTVSGIERVYVYLTDPTGALIRLQGGTGSVASGSFSPAAVLDPNDSTWDDYRMVIDNRLEEGNDGGAAGDADGIPEFLTISAGDYLWSGQFDSTLVPDGVVTVNVTAEDFAGNRSSTTVDRFVANNRPLIDSVVLGTDLDGDGSIAVNERSTPLTSGYGATGFTARNNLLLFDIAVSGGNGTLRYSVRYDADGDTVYEPTEELNATLTNGVLTVDTAGIPDSALNGAVFEVRVYDSTTSDDADSTDELSDVITIGLTIDNIDDVAPTVDVAPFGERYSESASDAAKILQAVTEFAENVVVSGGGTLLGHVDYAADSVFHNPSADADLSGEVVFLGRVADNQRVDRIEVAITGYDPDGAGAATAGDAFTVYDASTTGAQSDTDWAFELDGANYLTDTDGNVFNWRFSWNTASHAAVVDRDVVLTVTAFDAATTPNTQSSQIEFDIVPYISGVSTDTTGIRDRNIRSASGRYSVASGNAAEHITITGFNLDPIANGVRIGSDTDGLNDGDGVTLEGTSLTVDVQGSPFTELRVRNDADRSGFLSVVTGAPGAPIPTLNNTNENALPQHQEPSDQANNPNLTDDRYLRFFDVTSTSYLNAGFPEMMMDVATGDTPVFGYIDKSADRDLQLRRDNDGIVRALNMTHSAMTRDDDGRYYQIGTNDFSGGRLELFYDQYATLYPTSSRGPDAGATQPYWSNYTGGNFSLNANNNAIALDALNYDGTFFANRYLYPKLEARGRSNTPGEFATLYMAYYDARDAELIFRDSRFGRTETGTELFNGSAAYSDVGTNMPNASPGNGDGDRHLVTGTASEYFDMAVTSGNQVVIIYYNQAATQLEMVYSTNVIDGTSTPTWSAPLSLGSLFSGTYVSMFIDDSDRIHVAAYDSAGADLRYFFLESITDTTPESVLVDANNSVGLWTEIGVNAAGELHIAYYNNSENGTRDSIKLARYEGTLPTVLPGVNGSGEATGNWEFMTVPTNSVPQGGLVQFNKVDVEFDSTGQPVVGYLGSNLEYARILPEIP